MDEESIKYIPEADHQHLHSQEREQEFVEEENADIDKFDQSGQDLLTHIPERIQKSENKCDQICQDLLITAHERLQKIDCYELDQICQDLLTRKHERLQKIQNKLDQICQDLLTCEQDIQKREKILEYILTRDEDIQKREKILEYIRTREEDIQKIEKILEYIWTREEDIQQREKILEYIRTREEDIQKIEKILQDIRTLEQEIIQKREKILQEIRTPMQERLQKSKYKTTKATNSGHPTITYLLLGSVIFASRFCSVGFIPVESNLGLCKTDLSKLTDTCDHDEGKAIHCVLNDEGELGIGSFSKIWVQQDLLSGTVQYLRTPMQERFQKSEDKTTKTTKSRHSTITSSLLGSVSSRFGSVGAEFIPVESVLSLCKTDLSKLTDTCGHDEGKAIHCVLNDEGELGIGCFFKIWVEQGYCPYLRTSFDVLDIRPCLANSSICPTDRDQYLSNEVYKYPGCLINNSRVLDRLTNQTTESTTIRSSDEGDKETMLLILVMILGLISFSLLLIHGLRFLRPMKINLRGLRSAYAPASMGQQDPQRDGLPDDGVDV